MTQYHAGPGVRYRGPATATDFAEIRGGMEDRASVVPAIEVLGAPVASSVDAIEFIRLGMSYQTTCADLQ